MNKVFSLNNCIGRSKDAHQCAPKPKFEPQLGMGDAGIFSPSSAAIKRL